MTDLASAQRAIEEILEQGEGPRGHWRDAHFGQFVEHPRRVPAAARGQPCLRAGPPGDGGQRPPARARRGRPADRRSAHRPGRRTCSTSATRSCCRSSSGSSRTPRRPTPQLKALADATVGAHAPGHQAARATSSPPCPVGEDHPGRTAGPSFELFYESDYLMPHREAAWALLAERLDEAAWLCDELQSGRGASASPASWTRCSPRCGRSPGAWPRTCPRAARTPGWPARRPGWSRPSSAALLERAAGLASAVAGRGGAVGPGPELSELFRAAHAIVTQAARRPGRGAGEQALIVPRLVGSVLRPLADALGGHRPPVPRPPARRRARAVPRPPEPRPPEPLPPARYAAGRVWEAARTATRAAGAPGPGRLRTPELAEATAALQDLAVRLAAPGEAAARLDELWELQAGLPASVQAERNGPYLVTNVPRLIDHLGAGTRPAPQLAPLPLRRLRDQAAVRRQPRQQRVHATPRIPNRVPDRRDTYDGQQLTDPTTTAASASTRGCAPTGWPRCSAPTPSRSWRPAAAGWMRSSGPCATARPGR